MSETDYNATRLAASLGVHRKGLESAIGSPILGDYDQDQSWSVGAYRGHLLRLGALVDAARDADRGRVIGHIHLIRHGKASMYTCHGCRCGMCTEAWRAYRHRNRILLS